MSPSVNASAQRLKRLQGVWKSLIFQLNRKACLIVVCLGELIENNRISFGRMTIGENISL